MKASHLSYIYICRSVEIILLVAIRDVAGQFAGKSRENSTFPASRLWTTSKPPAFSVRPTVNGQPNIDVIRIFSEPMEDEAERLTDKVQELGDIELAVLLCLITEEHCIIQAETGELENVEQELRLVRMPKSKED
jgi:hypothetical protein